MIVKVPSEINKTRHYFCHFQHVFCFLFSHRKARWFDFPCEEGDARWRSYKMTEQPRVSQEIKKWRKTTSSIYVICTPPEKKHQLRTVTFSSNACILIYCSTWLIKQIKKQISRRTSPVWCFFSFSSSSVQAYVSTFWCSVKPLTIRFPLSKSQVYFLS